MDAVRRMDGVRDAEARRDGHRSPSGGTRSVAQPESGRLSDPLDIHIGKVWPETGLWPPAKRSVTLERASLPYLGLAIGDTLTVETPGNRLAAASGGWHRP